MRTSWQKTLLSTRSQPDETIFLAREAVLKPSRIINGLLVKQRGAIMLSEKFILILEAILKSNGRSFPDGSPRVVSTSPHVPVKIPTPSSEARL
jgi:hypothetical protein